MFSNIKYVYNGNKCLIYFRNNWKQTTKEKLAIEKYTELEKMCKEKAFNTTLYSYLNLCVSKSKM